MKAKTLLLVISLVFGITACGGGGGGSASSGTPLTSLTQDAEGRVGSIPEKVSIIPSNAE